jgi:hypothetical protein
MDSDAPEIFFSYSRSDEAFVDRIAAALAPLGFSPTIDRHSIEGGEDWRRRLGQMIARCSSVVAVITPPFLASEICAWEIAEAERLAKRIVPVAPSPLDRGAPVPESLARLHRIDFDPDFQRGMMFLQGALRADMQWRRRMADAAADAQAWKEGGAKPKSSHLYYATRLNLFEQTLRSAPGGAEIPALLAEFYYASAKLDSGDGWPHRREHLRRLAGTPGAVGRMLTRFPPPP